jgi:hypothetical protein
MRGVKALRRAGDRTLKEPGVTARHCEQGFDQFGMLQFRLHELLSRTSSDAEIISAE